MLVPKNEGGLNLTPIRVKNQALLGKWWFKWLVERKASWNNIICLKYECSRFNGPRKALVGKNISSVLDWIISVNDVKGFNLAPSISNFSWISRDGRSALFWEDSWSKGASYVKFFQDYMSFRNWNIFHIEISVKFSKTRVQAFVLYGSVSCGLRSWRRLLK